tara:strand:+ start:974 stop:1204 length:231 start_codon:yes stop_codon:yes gene_type:complete
LLLKSERGCGVRFPTIGQTWSSGDIKAGFKSQLLLYLGGNAKKEIALDYLYSIEETYNERGRYIRSSGTGDASLMG